MVRNILSLWHGKITTWHRLNAQKKDEFYTQITDIEHELCHYRAHFRGKTVLCNCDDSRASSFFCYFVSQFNVFGLKRLITTCYRNENEDAYSKGNDKHGLKLVYDGGEDCEFKVAKLRIQKHTLRGDGSFDSDECRALLEEADIVVTNPPFSRFRDFVALMMEYNKKFLIIGNQNAITYKEIFPLIKENKLWSGISMNGSNRWFEVPKDYEVRPNAAGYKEERKKRLLFVNGVRWFTNMEHSKRNLPLELYKTYTPEAYPRYDNYDAIECSKVADIPKDYDGIMGVPITFLDKYNPEQFEIVGASESEGKGFSMGLWHEASRVSQPLVNGQKKYKRLFIRRIK